MIFIGNTETRAEAMQIFERPEYAERRKSPYVVYGKDGALQQSHYDVLASLVAPSFVQGARRALDVGSFDGQFLLALERLRPNIECHGYDVSDHIGNFFPNRANYRYWSGRLEDVPGKYDLITLICVIMYVPGPGWLMSRLREMLDQRGTLFIVVPDAESNPHSLLYGDQLQHYTPANLQNLMHHCGFAVDLLKTPHFPRNVVALCRPQAKALLPPSTPDHALERGIAYLDRASEMLIEGVSRWSTTGKAGRLTCLGISPNAAWAQMTLNGRIDTFVDENRLRHGTKFRGRPVGDPASLTAQDLIILPYGATAGPIAEKFRSRYAAQLLPV